MKLRVALAIALLFNLLLLTLLLLKPAKIENGRGTPTAEQGKTGKASAAAAAAMRTTTALETDKLDWRSIESEDYRAYIKNLREIKCPEETIRDIIIADVNKLFARRRARIQFPAVTNSFLM